MMKRTGLMILTAVLFLALLSLNGAIAADSGFEMQEQAFQNDPADLGFEMEGQALENGLPDFDFEMEGEALENGLIDGITEAAWQCRFYWYSISQGFICYVWSDQPWGWVNLNAYQGGRYRVSVDGRLTHIFRVWDGWMWRYEFLNGTNELRKGEHSISFWGHLDHLGGNRLVCQGRIRIE